MNDFVSLYVLIHIAIYYEDFAKVKALEVAFEEANEFIRYLRPYGQMTDYKLNNSIKRDIAVK